MNNYLRLLFLILEKTNDADTRSIVEKIIVTINNNTIYN